MDVTNKGVREEVIYGDSSASKNVKQKKGLTVRTGGRIHGRGYFAVKNVQ